MGEYREYQPLTRRDRATVILYRAGIVLSTVIFAIATVMAFGGAEFRPAFNALLPLLHLSIAMSVFFIHLYVRSYKRSLMRLYFIGLGAFIALFALGRGDSGGFVAEHPWGLLFLLPLAGCLAFVTAKEAFCFRFPEGYLLSLLLPLFILLLATGRMGKEATGYGLLLISILLVFFTTRKVFMPLHTDIGDKSAYV